jgi:hypothetical protein
MANAALTYVYNESVNLPIWIKYYGRLFGSENLFVIDRQSNDGSTDNLGKVNVIRVPRTAFDDHDKSHAMSSMHSALLRSYDTVVCTDCDEILIPDPDKFADLNQYIADSLEDYATGIGISISHAIDREMPLDLNLPIFAQRRYASFASSECKTLISRVPQVWAPGLHAIKMPPKFESGLFVFHLKLMDYTIAVRRQMINRDTVWSEKSLRIHHGEHHRFELQKFVGDTFLSTVSLIDSNNVFDFEFQSMVDQLIERTTVSTDGFHQVPFGVSKKVTIPERFRSLL